MRLVLAGTEITSLISIKECEGPLHPPPRFSTSTFPPRLSPFIRSSHGWEDRLFLLSLSLFLFFSVLRRGASSFVSISRSSSYLVRDFATQHTLSTLLAPPLRNSSLVSTRVNVITDERDTVAHFPSPSSSLRVSSDARMYRWIEFFGVEASSRFHILFVPFFLSLRIRKKESFERENKRD